MENKTLPKVDFPMKIYWGEEPISMFKTENESINVNLISMPTKDFRKNCYKMIMSTWERFPVRDATETQISKTFKELLTGKVLPNSMESLTFTFRIGGLTHIEISHMLRHRTFFGIHAVCSGDRDLRHDDIMIPESIRNSEYAEEYMKLSEECKKLYAKMIDDKKISLMDARYILNRNHTYYYYFSMNLKDVIMFINQRKCSAIQPYTDNLIAEGIYNEIISIIPELKDVLSLKCDKNCHFVKSSLEKNTRLYQPDKTHSQFFEYNPENFIYDKTRTQMGIPKWVQDD